MIAAIRMFATYAGSFVTRQERGQTVAEYAMIIGFVSIAIVLAFIVADLDGAVSTLVSEIQNLIKGTDRSGAT